MSTCTPEIGQADYERIAQRDADTGGCCCGTETWRPGRFPSIIFMMQSSQARRFCSRLAIARHSNLGGALSPSFLLPPLSPSLNSSLFSPPLQLGLVSWKLQCAGQRKHPAVWHSVGSGGGCPKMQSRSIISKSIGICADPPEPHVNISAWVVW